LERVDPMRGIWVILTVVCVLAMAGLVFIYGTRSGTLEEELKADLEKLRATPEYKTAVAKIEEIKKTVADAVGKAGDEIEKVAEDLKAKAEPEWDKACTELEHLAKQLNLKLEEFKTTLARKLIELDKAMVKLTEQGRQKAVEGLAWAETKADEITDAITRTVADVKLAAAKGIDDAAEELDEQKQKLEKQLEKVDKLRKKMTEDQVEPEEF
jgi:hypothetical protein